VSTAAAGILMAISVLFAQLKVAAKMKTKTTSRIMRKSYGNG
jgi:hypothetical protein